MQRHMDECVSSEVLVGQFRGRKHFSSFMDAKLLQPCLVFKCFCSFDAVTS